MARQLLQIAQGDGVVFRPGDRQRAVFKGNVVVFGRQAGSCDGILTHSIQGLIAAVIHGLAGEDTLIFLILPALSCPAKGRGSLAIDHGGIVGTDGERCLVDDQLVADGGLGVFAGTVAAVTVMVVVPAPLMVTLPLAASTTATPGSALV